jgi:hypothetical protein
MAFIHGKDAQVMVNGRKLSDYLHTAGVMQTGEVADTTVFGKAAKTFIAGLKDGSLSAEGLFDGAAGAADAVFQAALGAAAVSLWTIYPGGDSALGNVGYSTRSRQTAHSVDAVVSDVVAVSAEAQTDDEIERCIAAHSLGAETAGANSASQDNAAATSAGAAAYLHVTAITGTNIIVKVQDSVDDVVWTDLITFTSATAAGTSERVAVTGTVKRYARTSWSGTFTSATFAVALNRK